MRLLILTQKVDVNDSLLGFMVGWISEFARHCEKVTVVCLEKGAFNPPANVKVLSLGKESGQARLKYLVNFYRHIWRERENYDTVFIHMNPEYAVLGGLLWRAWGKKISLWYTHKGASWRLRLAEKLVHIVFTASAESFRLPSKKVNIMGHGIDVELFTPASAPAKEKIILNIDRVSPTKNQLAIIKIYESIGKKVVGVKLWLAGAPARAADEVYLDQLKKYVQDNNLTVKFLGAVANQDTPALYRRAKVFVNFSATGSLDKNVLEAMACGLPAVTTNAAFKNILPAGNYGLDFLDAEKKVVYFLEHDRPADYRQIIVRGHSLKNLIAGLIRKLI